MIDKIRAYIGGEPVRAAVYSVATAVLGLLVVAGKVSAEDAAEYAGLAAFVLGVNAVRAKVTPAAKADAEVRRAKAGIPQH